MPYSFPARTKSNSFVLFLIGLFSVTQINVIGSIGVSEVVCYVAAPFVLIKNWKILVRDGFKPVIILSFLTMLGCCLSSWHNHTIFPFFIRGFAVVYSLFALPVCLHGLLHKNLGGLKWVLLGICISLIINVFFFRQAVEVSLMSGGEETADTAERIMSGPLFWLQRLGGWITLPVKGWYLATPYFYSLVAPLIMSVYTIVTSDSGRSAIACAFATCGIIFLGRKRVSSMRIIQKHFILFLFSCIILALVLKIAYTALATSGKLNERAMRKYEGQMKTSTSLIGMLIGGRSETFAGLFACFDNPIWGYGPWSVDEKDYSGQFILKYGDYDDYIDHAKRRALAISMGWRMSSMPSHSHIIGFWVRYGILGLPFWLYIVYCMYRHFRHNMASIPQWYGYFAFALASYSWHIIFSPYGNRVDDCLFITCLLLADSVRRGRIQLPFDMIHEISKKDSNAIGNL